MSTGFDKKMKAWKLSNNTLVVTVTGHMKNINIKFVYSYSVIFNDLP